MSRDDPTAGWPVTGEVPVLDLETGSVGPMRLGDALEAARAFGRPKKVRGSPGGNTLLLYERFELEFTDGALACVKFDMDDRSRVQMARDIVLTRATKPLDATVWFGDPASDSAGGGSLRWLDFERDGATLALEFDARGLTCVQLYAEGYA